MKRLAPLILLLVFAPATAAVVDLTSGQYRVKPCPPEASSETCKPFIPDCVEPNIKTCEPFFPVVKECPDPAPSTATVQVLPLPVVPVADRGANAGIPGAGSDIGFAGSDTPKAPASPRRLKPWQKVTGYAVAAILGGVAAHNFGPDGGDDPKDTRHCTHGPDW